MLRRSVLSVTIDIIKAETACHLTFSEGQHGSTYALRAAVDQSGLEAQHTILPLQDGNSHRNLRLRPKRIQRPVCYQVNLFASSVAESELFLRNPVDKPNSSNLSEYYDKGSNISQFLARGRCR